MSYNKLSKELQERIKEDRAKHWVNPYSFPDEDIIRRDNDRDKANVWRPAFVRDIEKIMHLPFYNRYSDKTQVFSLVKNDDISRRSYHVQLVSRIARNIGAVLGLNNDLIEAISLGHDIGHTPFGHAGERIINELYHGETGRYFNHNIQSARVLDKIADRNISLQTLDGVICHNGEMECQEYRPVKLASFEEYDAKVEECYVDRTAVGRLVPGTLEACVMRISDIIAYLGKDRQDAIKIGMLHGESEFSGRNMGTSNAEIINNLIVNIIENSYGKDYICMDEEYYDELVRAKKENYQLIYRADEGEKIIDEQIKPMAEQVYYKLLKDIKAHDEASIIYRHHMDFVKNDLNRYTYKAEKWQEYVETEPNQLVVDYMASMTDDYFVDIYNYLFPDGRYKVEYKGYFE
ncbi:MAG: deoxyguanosinetriphosphate triphosphohydrolase family protein [Coprococcus sp.]